MPGDVVAVIPTFRPTSALFALVSSLLPQVSRLLLADDASPCTFDPILREASSQPGVSLLRFFTNAGVARSLNAGLALAREHQTSWLLTLDQDSQISPVFVRDLVTSADLALLAGLQVGVIGPEIIKERSGSLDYPIREEGTWLTTAEVFQSGSLWSVQALSRRGGFDESLGIDAVDAEACLGLRESGYFVALAPNVSLDHSWGNTRQLRVFGRNIAVTEHSAERRTFMVRNRLRLFPREFRQSPRHAFVTLRRMAIGTLLAITIEGDRRRKARASVRGVLSINGPSAPTTRPSEKLT